MDDRIFQVKLIWANAIVLPLVPAKGFPTLGLVMDDNSGEPSGWSVLVAPYETLENGIANAYLMYVFFDLAPMVLQIGSKITLRRGDVVAIGEVTGVAEHTRWQGVFSDLGYGAHRPGNDRVQLGRRLLD